MRHHILAALLAALPASAAAQTTGAEITLRLGGWTDAPQTLGRVHADGLATLGNSGLQFGATFGALAEGETLTDLRVIAFQSLGRRWTYGAEAQYSTDAVLGGADYALGFRLRYGDAGGTVDTRLALAQNGYDGAFSVTVVMDQTIGADSSVRGMLHRYSTNTETGDFFAIGLGGETALSPRLYGYGSAIWALADDFSEETTAATLGLGTDLGPGLRGFAGLSARQTDGDTGYGLTTGLTWTLGDGPFFDTDPFGQQLAHLGR